MTTKTDTSARLEKQRQQKSGWKVIHLIQAVALAYLKKVKWWRFKI